MLQVLGGSRSKCYDLSVKEELRERTANPLQPSTPGAQMQPVTRVIACSWGLWFGVWCLVFGVWCLVFGVWCLGFGVCVAVTCRCPTPTCGENGTEAGVCTGMRLEGGRGGGIVVWIMAAGGADGVGRDA